MSGIVYVAIAWHSDFKAVLGVFTSIELAQDAVKKIVEKEQDNYGHVNAEVWELIRVELNDITPSLGDSIEDGCLLDVGEKDREKKKKEGVLPSHRFTSIFSMKLGGYYPDSRGIYHK